jgi:hypothetical protein
MPNTVELQLHASTGSVKELISWGCKEAVSRRLVPGHVQVACQAS